MLIISSLIGFPTQLIAQPLEIVPVLTPSDYIVKYANQFNTDPNVLLKVAKCESEIKQTTKGDYLNGTYLAIGLFQYHQGTWIRHSKLLGEELDRDSVEDQAKLAAYIFANYPEARNEWTTYRAIMNGGVYSFYSKLLGKHYTVICR